MKNRFPKAQGLYDPQFEKDSCGVGFVCNIEGEQSHELIEKAITVLKRLTHRGAVGADPDTGDGAGLLIQIPHEFCVAVAKKEKITLPKKGLYGTGLIFLPQDGKERSSVKRMFKGFIEDESLTLLGWRSVPVDSTQIGKTAQKTAPVIEQVFIGRGKKVKDELSFERALFLVRKQIETAIRTSKLKDRSFFYVNSLSCRTFLYKGLLMPEQLDKFFPDLRNPLMKSALSIVHSRYSTNTFPTWDLAQPFRFLAHNGEINTLRGNINWMAAREGQLANELLGDDLSKIKPVIVPNMSDSASLDNAFELLMMSGRSLYHSLMMLIPPAWEQNTELDGKLRDFYRYHACFMEPWDGPAAIAVTDGTRIGALLDRNGLRPARYLVTRDKFVVMSSEIGVLDIDPATIVTSGRLEPGKIFFIDTLEGRIITDAEIKKSVATQKPYSAWVKKHVVNLADVEGKTAPDTIDDLLPLMKTFGYTREDRKVILKPMAEEGQEPTGSMGNDTPHAVLSQKPQLLYNYFKQLFAQVTNPAVDPIREEIVMSLESYLGAQRNILDETPQHCHKVFVKEPVISAKEFANLHHLERAGFKTRTISLLFDITEKNAFNHHIQTMCKETEEALCEGVNLIILSDRGVDATHAALPALLATGALHHYLTKKALRTQVSIIVESFEPREIQHFVLLFGYGADLVYPYGAYAILGDMEREGELSVDAEKAIYNFRKACHKGILKVLSKMGISTLHSYRGAQIFEALGIDESVINVAFVGTPSRIKGMTMKGLEQETRDRHDDGFGEKPFAVPHLATGGVYQWKRDGEFHLWNPDTIALIQDATHKNDYGIYQQFASLINDQSKQPTTLRSLLRFKKAKAISIDEVEPIEDIVKRFATGAMSFGSISKGAHETLALAMNRLGGKSNTGEGGEDPVRFQRLANGDSLRSAIKQVASGRFGVTANYLVHADELQIKIAQGAKPGEGGQLPGHKVSEIIARTRYTTPGVTLISPPPHHDIYSIEDLAQLIYDLKNVNPKARISVKLVSEIGVGTIAAGVAKGHADMILISGFDGGTGASPISSIKHAGLPWELGLSETHQTLVLNDLRSRVRLQTDGQMRTGRDVAIATMLGAEEYGFCTVALIVMGCVMLRHCHLNNCSLGVATQDDLLQKKFRGKADHVVNYMLFVARELREIMASLGIRTINEMVGRTDLLEMNSAIKVAKTDSIDYSRILYSPKMPKSVGRYQSIAQNHAVDKVLDRELIHQADAALRHQERVEIALPIQNHNRTTGAMLSGEICSRYGESGLPEDTISCTFTGVAGQSFGAFLANGVTFRLEGIANDYVGKGISGGRIIIYPSKRSPYQPGENSIIGNTAFYGAISGEAYIRGKAGERFCIRNSGLYVVVEGVGDHGCEYMTGGKVVILGETGRNFGAGMSGGIAYVYDPKKNFQKKCNMSMIEFDAIDNEDTESIMNLLRNHVHYTGSTKAKKIIDTFPQAITAFVKVMPTEYKRILSVKKINAEKGMGIADGF